MSDQLGERVQQTDVRERFAVHGIKECTQCGDTGDPNEKYGVDGIARIAGNLCVDCVRELVAEEDQ